MASTYSNLEIFSLHHKHGFDCYSTIDPHAGDLLDVSEVDETDDGRGSDADIDGELLSMECLLPRVWETVVIDLTGPDDKDQCVLDARAAQQSHASIVDTGDYRGPRAAFSGPGVGQRHHTPFLPRPRLGRNFPPKAHRRGHRDKTIRTNLILQFVIKVFPVLRRIDEAARVEGDWNLMGIRQLARRCRLRDEHRDCTPEICIRCIFDDFSQEGNDQSEVLPVQIKSREEHGKLATKRSVAIARTK